MEVKLNVQKPGAVDEQEGIYKMKRVECDWDGDGQLNRPQWAGAMKTQTTKEKSESGESNAENTQIMAEGVIIPMYVPCRPEITDPWNGFPTGGNTGFVDGRIIPFELGGMNSKSNIIPMPEGWDEENGGWNKMTEAVAKYVTTIYGWE